MHNEVYPWKTEKSPELNRVISKFAGVISFTLGETLKHARTLPEFSRDKTVPSSNWVQSIYFARVQTRHLTSLNQNTFRMGTIRMERIWFDSNIRSFRRDLDFDRSTIRKLSKTRVTRSTLCEQNWYSRSSSNVDYTSSAARTLYYTYGTAMFSSSLAWKKEF